MHLKMYTATAALILLFNAGLACADTDNPDECENLDAVAEASMQARQAGVPMAKVYKIAGTTDKAVSGTIKMVVEAAYTFPKYSSEAAQREAVTSFRDVMFQACLKERKKQGR